MDVATKKPTLSDVYGYTGVTVSVQTGIHSEVISRNSCCCQSLSIRVAGYGLHAKHGGKPSLMSPPNTCTIIECGIAVK